MADEGGVVKRGVGLELDLSESHVTLLSMPSPATGESEVLGEAVAAAAAACGEADDRRYSREE